MSKYPLVNDDNFQKEISKGFSNYKIPDTKKSFNEICFPKKYELQLPQKFLGEYINPKTGYTKILVNHGIGSGKTCSGINVCEKWIGKKRIVVVSPASLINNFRGELRSLCVGNKYITENEKKELEKLHPSSQKYKDIIQKSNERIDKYYEIYSYHKFVSSIKKGELSIKNCLLLIDEVQNMISEDGTFYKTLYDTIKKNLKGLILVLLSATPMFDKPSEIALLMNLMLDNEMPTGKDFNSMFIKITKNATTGEYKYFTQNMDVFKKYISGYVSYYRGAPPHVYPEAIVKYVKCEMEPFQYDGYKIIMGNNKILEKGDILDLPVHFLIGPRKISNIVFPNKKIDEEGEKSLVGKYLKIENIASYSIKFYKIIKKIMKSTGPVIVYSGFLEGSLKSFAKVLDGLGYKNYNDHGDGSKRYAMMTGEDSIEHRDELKNVFNNKNNIQGKKIKIMLISPAIKEGVSFMNVKQMHIMEPYWNMSRLLQIEGRAIRFCSHRLLDGDDRFCNVYIYVATSNKEKETVDQYIAKIAAKKALLISEFEHAIKESAIDCGLNINANSFKTDERKIVCDYLR